MGTINTLDETGLNKDYTLAGEPFVELKYKENKTITMDARLGKEVKISTPKESEQHITKIGYRQDRLTGIGGFDILKVFASVVWDHTYVIPTGPVPGLEFEFQQRRFAPRIKASFDGTGGSIPLEPISFVPRLDGHKNLEAVYVGTGKPEDLKGKDIHGKLAVVTRDIDSKPATQIKALEDAGAKGVVLLNDRPGIYAISVLRTDNISIPAWTLGQEDGAVLLDRIANGPTLINLNGIADSPYVYNIAMMVPGGIPDNPVDQVTAENSAVVKAHYRNTDGW